MSDNPEETTYYLRIIAMYTDLGTETARKVFQHYMPGNDATAYLASPEIKKKLSKLRKDKILNTTEYNLLTSSNPTPEKFDIALLVRLLINLFGDKLPRPHFGWNGKLQPFDDSLGADLRRIRDMRNKLIAHRPNARLSKEDFERIWNKIEAILLRIIKKVEPDSCLTMESKLRDYKKGPLDPLDTTIQTNLEKYTAWNNEITKLQQQVEDLRKATKEFHLYFRRPPERYVRYIKLLFEGGSLVMCGIIQRELDKTNSALRLCLQNKKEELKKAVEDKQLRDQLFPSSNCISDPSKWDIWLLATTILILYGDSISQAEKRNLQLIRDARENYADSAISSLDTDLYIPIWTDLTNCLNKLAQNVDEETALQVEGLIEKYKKKGQEEDTAEAYMDKLRSNGACVKTLSDIYKDNMNKLHHLVGEMDEKGIKLKKNHVFEVKLETNCENEDKKIAAEESLRRVCKEYFEGVDTSQELEPIQRETNKMFRNISNIHDVEITGVTNKCILIEIRCMSFSGIQGFISYVLSQKFKDRIQGITNELCHMYDEVVAVFGNVTFECIHEVLDDPCNAFDKESASGINIPITCSTSGGMQQVLSLLSDEDTANSLNQIAEQLSFQVNETVTLKAFPVLDEFCAVFGETDSENSGSGNLSFEEEAEDRFSSAKGKFREGNQTPEADDITKPDQTLHLKKEISRKLEQKDTCIEENLFEDTSNKTQFKDILKQSKQVDVIHKQSAYSKLEQSEDLRLSPIFSEGTSICSIRNRDLSYDEWSLLSSSLSKQKNEIRRLIINKVYCTKSECEGYYLDLSEYVKLQNVSLFNCRKVFLSHINPHLESFEIVDFFCSYSHEMLLSLSSSISRAVNLKKLILHDLKCSESRCDGHVIDLSKHDKLQRLTMNVSPSMLLSEVSPHLESCEINDFFFSDSHTILLQLLSSVSRAVNLKRLKICGVTCLTLNCEAHSIDLSKHGKLQTLTLTMNISGSLCLPDTNSHLLSCEIGGWCCFSHESLLSLSSGISHAVNLKMLKLGKLKCSKVGCKGHIIDLSKHDKLQSLTMNMTDALLVSDINRQLESCEIQDSKYSHEILLSLSSGISHAVNLKMLNLGKMKCSKVGCDGHTIDLSKHDKLQSLTMSMTDALLVSDINRQLKSCEIQCSEYPHEILLSLSSGISRAVNLKMLKLDELKCSKSGCEVHIIDLSKHVKLKGLTLTTNVSESLLLSDINSHLKSCEINRFLGFYSHDILLSLSSGISRAVNLKMLKLEGLKCSTCECEGHVIDLSKHGELQSLTMNMSRNIFLSDINPNLKSCTIQCFLYSHKSLLSLSSSLSRAVNLKELKLFGLECSKAKCEGHVIDLSKHDKLQSVTMNMSQSLCLSDINPHLESCEIQYLLYSHGIMLSLSAAISRAVNLKILKLCGLACLEPECEGHAIDLSKYENLPCLYINECYNLYVKDLKSAPYPS